MDGWVRVLRPFNSISVISRQWEGEHERLCAMKRRLGSERISPPAGFEPATLWSEVGSANCSATRMLLLSKELKTFYFSYIWCPVSNFRWKEERRQREREEGTRASQFRRWLVNLIKTNAFLIIPKWNNLHSEKQIRSVFEPAHKIMALFDLRKNILQTRMHSHPVGLDVWVLVGPFVYFHTSCVRTVKALANCADPQACLSLRWSPVW